LKEKVELFSDVLPVVILDAFTSIFAGTAIFSVYLEAISTMTMAPLWSIFFFVMLLLLGIDSQVSSI
jgi:hypothetical protein